MKINHPAHCYECEQPIEPKVDNAVRHPDTGQLKHKDCAAYRLRRIAKLMQPESELFGEEAC